MTSMTAEQYIEKYIDLIDMEQWDVFWDGAWYWLNNKETARLLDLLDSIGISKASSYSIREYLYRYWLGSLLKVCPDRKEVSILLYSDMRNQFGLTDDECLDIFVDEINNYYKNSLYLDEDDMFIRKKVTH